MGPPRSPPATAAAALAAAVVLLAGCGSLDVSWTPAAEAASTPTESTTPSRTPSTTISPDSATTTASDTATTAESDTAAPTPSDSAAPTPSTTPTPSATPIRPTPTPSPTPTITAKPRTSLIRGDSGPHVLAMQKRLEELCYWLGTPDGAYGSLTQQAVWAFQKAAGLKRDGVVGPRTLRALEAGVRPKAALSGDG